MFKLIVIFLILSFSGYSARRSTTSSGVPLWWRSLINIPYSINLYTNSWPLDHPTLDSREAFEEAIEKSFRVWESTGHVSFQRGSNTYLNPNNSNICGCSDIQYGNICWEMGCSWNGISCSGDGIEFDCCYKNPSKSTCQNDSINSCYWVDDSGCFGDCQLPEGSNLLSNVKENWLSEAAVIAHTVIWYYVNDGEIIDVDLLINNQQWGFDMGDSSTHYNLQAILVHEIGHLIGIAHPCSIDLVSEPWAHCNTTGGIYSEATMYPVVQPDDDEKLITLEEDDLLALEMVCDDPKTLCLSNDFYGDVKVKQGFGCLGTTDINKNTRTDFSFFLIALVILLTLYYKRRFIKSSF